jgi:hypothetical protein
MVPATYWSNVGGVMRVALTKPKRAHAFLTFGLPLFLMPSLIGGPDLSTSASDAGFPSGQAKSHLIGSPFGTIHTATFQFPVPLGSAMPDVAKPTPANFTRYEGETDQSAGGSPIGPFPASTAPTKRIG